MKISLNLFSGCLLLFLFLSAPLEAQLPGNRGQQTALPEGTGAIAGTVVDNETGMPVGFANILVYPSGSDSSAGGTNSNEEGRFFIKGLAYGQYKVVVSFLGFEEKVIEAVAISESHRVTRLGNVTISESASFLEEIEVVAEREMMQMGLDKKIFNVSKDLSSRGGTAADVLDNVPSVTVDLEGNVELRGSGGVRILIDGKPSGLVGIRNSDGLRQIPAAIIERVEVITNPSAKYEAEGMAGIINIVLKKEQNKGFNGSFGLTTGYPDNHRVSGNLNYRTDKFNFFLNYGLQYRKSPGFSKIYQEFYQNNTTSITQQYGDRERGGWSNSAQFGADYYFNANNILTTSLNYRYGRNNNTNEIEYFDYVSDLDNLRSYTTRRDDEKETEPNQEYALSYKKILPGEGHEWTVDFRYQDNKETEDSDLLQQNFGADQKNKIAPDLHQRSLNEESQENIIFQTDYTKPFGNDGKIESGLRSGLRTINTDYLVEEKNEQDAWVRIADFSNNFIYDENIHAAYASVGNKFMNFSWQAGLRYEYSDIRTELVQGDSINDRQYSNLFPSAFLGYELTKTSVLQASYSRRIRRPGFWALNPFFTYSDPRNFWSGNPNLEPEFTHAFEIGFLKYLNSGTLSSSVYYRRTTDVIDRIRFQVSDTSSFIQPVNLAEEDNFGLELTMAYNILKNWRINGNFNFFRSITNGTYENQTYDADTYTWFARISTKATLFKKLDAQLNFNYRAPRETTQGNRKAVWTIDPALSMDVLGGNGTITLSVRDLFNTRVRVYETFGDNFFTNGEFQWRARQTTLSFNYRIKQKKSRSRSSGGSDYEGGEGGGY